MANTRQSQKRAKVEKKRRARNVVQSSKLKSIVKAAVEGIENNKDVKGAQEKLRAAFKSLAKAGSKKLIPPKRAARKISRLTKRALKMVPDALGSK